MRVKKSLLLAALPLCLLLSGFIPFTAVTDVCPTCPKAKTDVVHFTTGQKVKCSVVAQNDHFYVLEYYGEYRAALRSEVSKVEWKDPNGASAIGTGDQLLTRTQILYHGSIVKEESGRYFIIQVGNLQHTVWANQVTNAYKGGKPYGFVGGAAPAAAAQPAAAQPAATQPAAAQPAGTALPASLPDANPGTAPSTP